MQIEEYLKRQVAENTHPSSWNVVIFLTAIPIFHLVGDFFHEEYHVAGKPRRCENKHKNIGLVCVYGLGTATMVLVLTMLSSRSA